MTSGTHNDRPTGEFAQFYGRRHGRRLRPGRARLMQELLPQLAVQLPAGADSLDPATLFTYTPRAVWLEIGFGAGEHLAAQAAAYPEIGFLGCEPFRNGVASLLAQIGDQGLSNVRIWPDDVRPLLARLQSGSVDRLFVLFSDPWPKARHQDRRLIQTATVAGFARLLRPGGELRLASDDPAYVRWILRHLLQEPQFFWLANSARDWRERPADWPATRYEAKALAAGRKPVFLRFRRCGPVSAVS